MLAFEHLPSELYEFVFMYLKSNDILVSFMNLNKRFTKLVHYQICRKVDVSLSKSDFHDILHYVQSTMQSIKLNDNQLNKVFPTTITSYPNLRSIILNNIPHVNGKYSVHIESFKTLYSLTLNFLFQCETPEIDQHVLFNKCSLEKLFITNCVLSLDSSNSIQMCQSIKYLTIKIQYQHHLFMLMENFPSLVYLNIQITKGIKSTDSYDYINGKLLPLNLKQFILDSSVNRILNVDHQLSD
ncbi:unnamed protein product [Didymodactylos carnosus]|uniref:F-box domain-containing protein n=1 Tax=Didymodactylos carnosus TaxID=1234261 RepID=A0A8S2FN95_9BILA|nr:unnamed protein product [Didymodactylos carnosus]CAF4306862.1 unnamed protein product [Didymodactylos carnosus]